MSQSAVDSITELSVSSSSVLSRSRLAALLAELLAEPADEIAALGDDEDLLSYGVDSIRLMYLQTRVNRMGYALTFDALARTPTQLDQALRGGWRALDTVLTVLHAPRFESPERGLQPQDAGIEAVRVGYRSNTGATLLENVDLRCPAGGFVAIVGPTGAGKSTLLGLLARLE